MVNLFEILRDIVTKLIFIIGPSDFRIFVARKYGVKIGKNCRVFACEFGSEPYLITIGNNCEITSGVKFITHDGATWIFRKDQKFRGTKYGPIIIRDNCMIGINTIILPDVEIGPNSVVGAGSVVTNNVPQNTVYAGNPAKLICTTDEYLQRCDIKNTGNIPSKSKRDTLSNMFKNKLS